MARVALLAVIFFLSNVTGLRAWEILHGVTLIPSASNDGDSFRAMHRGQEYIFRLYGADCPETDTSFPDRVNEQAAAFGVSPEVAVTWGHQATQRTEEALRLPFRVVTKWEDALGRSNLPRHYAYILPAGGGDLAAKLLSEGLARARGKSPQPPSGFPRVGRGEEYRQMQARAKASGRGVWGEKSTSYGKSPKDLSTSQATQSQKVNVNRAEKHEIEALPGIGSVLAERIIQSRPHKNEDDLLRINGLGPGKMSQIRGLVTF